MAFGDAYLTVEEFKARTREQSLRNDDAIAAALESSSRQIDGHCGREFNQSENDEYKIIDLCQYGDYRWGPNPIALGDVVSVTEIASDDGTGTYASVWDVDSYVLFPRRPKRGWPYTSVKPAPLRTSASWPITGYPIRVAGVFGWPEVPAPVKEVCFLMTNRLKSLYDAPFGASGSSNPEVGGLDMTMSITPLLKQMLKPFVVRTV